MYIVGERITAREAFETWRGWVDCYIFAIPRPQKLLSQSSQHSFADITQENSALIKTSSRKLC